MNSLVVYDSNYGNTQKVAEAIASAISATQCANISNIHVDQLSNVGLLICGSPINGWRPTARMSAWLKAIPAGALKNTHVATFDTRMNVWYHGDAAGKMLQALRRAGGRVAGKPIGCIVETKDGPLRDGELNRAADWAKKIIQTIS